MIKIKPEVAAQEIDKWLDLKSVPNRKRENNAEHVEALVDAVANGKLIMEPDGFITLKLSHPTGEKGDGVKELKFKPRIKVSTLGAQLQGLKAGDAIGIMVGYISAITGEAKGVIKDLDLVDYDLAQSIAIFFI